MPKWSQSETFFGLRNKTSGGKTVLMTWILATNFCSSFEQNGWWSRGRSFSREPFFEQFFSYCFHLCIEIKASAVVKIRSLVQLSTKMFSQYIYPYNENWDETGRILHFQCCTLSLQGVSHCVHVMCIPWQVD